MTRRSRTSDLLQPAAQPWHRWKLSTQKLAVLVSAAAVITGFSYVLITNNTAKQGFDIRSLQNKIDSLAENNQKLELKAADLRSLSSVQATSTQLGLVQADNFQYLAPTTGAVAIR